MLPCCADFTEAWENNEVRRIISSGSSAMIASEWLVIGGERLLSPRVANSRFGNSWRSEAEA